MSRYSPKLLILWVGFVLRTWNLGAASLWIDEVVTANRVHFSFADSLGSIIGAGNQVPFYYLLMRSFPTYNEFLLRLPSAFAGMLSIALIMLIAADLYHDQTVTLLAGALLAFSPMHIWLSRMARAYALLIALSLLVSYLFIDMLETNPSRPKWIAFVLGSTATYLTHYFGLILLFTQLVFLLVCRRATSRFKRCWIVVQCIAVAPFLLWFLPLAIIDLLKPGHLIGKGTGWVPHPHALDLLLTFSNMAIGYDGSRLWGYLPGLLAALTLLCNGLIHTFRRANTWNLYWFTLAIPLPLIVYLVSGVKPLYVDRYFSIGLPAVLMLMVASWQRLPCSALRWLTVGTILLTEVSSVGFTLQKGRDEKTDWRGLAAYVRISYQPGDSILFEAKHVREPFEYYFGTLDDSAVQTLSEPAGPGVSLSVRLWAVYPDPRADVHRQGALPDFDPFSPGVSQMGDWLIEHRTTIFEQRDFNGIKLFLIGTEKP
jgi:4-amino-4-deoxy-L-arabinose transferase-like glycosyltransferase